MQASQPGTVTFAELICRGKDASSGFEVFQLTSTPFLHGPVCRSGICGTSRFVLYTRQPEPCAPVSIWRADLDELENTLVCDRADAGLCSVSADGSILTSCRRNKSMLTVIRTDTASLKYETFRFALDPPYKLLGVCPPMNATSRIVLTADVLGRPCALEFDPEHGGFSETAISSRPESEHHFLNENGWFIDAPEDGYLYVGAAGMAPVRTVAHGNVSGDAPYSKLYAWVTPDGRHMIYNSNRYGLPQIFAVSLPDGFFR